MTSTSSVVTLAQIDKSYQLGHHSVTALRGVTLALQPGEFVGVTGPSGSGKSTMLNIAGLLDTPDAGSVHLNTKDVAMLSDNERTVLRREYVGFIFQHFNLVPVMSVSENVEYPLFLTGTPRRERRQRVRDVLQAVGLSEHSQHRPDALSGGQRQRVAIARALIKRPRLVIADEPTASLDSHTADQVLNLMRERCHQEGCAFLIATHDQRLTGRCDRIVNMTDGMLQ